MLEFLKRQLWLKIAAAAAGGGFVVGAMLALGIVAREESPMVLDDYGLLPTAWPLMLVFGAAAGSAAAGLVSLIVYPIVSRMRPRGATQH